MRLRKNVKYLVVYIAVLWAAMSFKADLVSYPENGTLKLNFQNYVGDQLLTLDSVVYHNSFNQPFTISKLKYYVGNFKFIRFDGAVVFKNEYFLLDQDEPGSLQLDMGDLPVGEYKSVVFLVGVDSIHNCSGIQSGSLDPAKGMFWAWNTGYVFFKMEGHAASSGSPGNMFEYHIGGYKTPYNNIRYISLDLGSHPLQISSNNTSELTVKADAGEVFKTPNPIDFSVLSSVTDLNNSNIIADNYRDMFSVLTVK